MEIDHFAYGTPYATQPIPEQILDASINPTFRKRPQPDSSGTWRFIPSQIEHTSSCVRPRCTSMHIAYIYGRPGSRLCPLGLRVEGSGLAHVVAVVSAQSLKERLRIQGRIVFIIKTRPYGMRGRGIRFCRCPSGSWRDP